MEHRPGTVVLALLLVTAGCSGSGGGTAGTPTVTPAPVPTDAPATRRLPPGVTAAGVVDASAVAAAHARALSGSYTVHATETVRSANGTLAAGRTLTIRRGPAHRRFAATVAVEGPDSIDLVGLAPMEARFWSDGDRYLRADTHNRSGPEPTYGTFAPPSEYIGGWSYWSYTVVPSGQPWRDIHPLLYTIETALAGRRVDNGTVLYAVESAGIANRKLFAMTERVAAPRAVRLRAVIERGGLVRRYRLTYAASHDDRPIRVTRTVRYEAVGATTVDRPPWYGAALAANASGTPA